MPSARVFGPWPEHSNPAASCLQWSCALQAEAVDTFFFFACAHLTRGRCCTSNLIAPLENVTSNLQTIGIGFQQSSGSYPNYTCVLDFGETAGVSGAPQA